MHMIGPSYDGHVDMIMIVLMILIMSWAVSVDMGPGRWESVFEFLQDRNSSRTPDLLLVPPNFISSIYLRFSSWFKAAEA